MSPPPNRWAIDTTPRYNDFLKVTVRVDGLESKQLSSRVHNLRTLALLVRAVRGAQLTSAKKAGAPGGEGTSHSLLNPLPTL